jgi:predicted RNase H-like nuclease (RuvC/YqgF family)
VPQLSLRKNGRKTTIYLTEEQREEIERIKMANGLRSLKQAYGVWKQAKQTLEESRSRSDPVPSFSPDPDADIKREEYTQDLEEENRKLRSDNTVLEATIKSLHKQIDDLQAKLGRRWRNRIKNDTNQRTINEPWTKVKEEMDEN